MADINLLGYGPHTLAASNDYYVQCVHGQPSRNKQLTIGVDRTAGDVTVYSRQKGSSAALEVQSYKKADETLAAAAIAADATVRVDATEKDIVLRTSVGANIVVQFGVDVEQ